MSVIVIGSSGGGAATLGHTDPNQLLSTIHKQLQKVAVVQTVTKTTKTTTTTTTTTTNLNSNSNGGTSTCSSSNNNERTNDVCRHGIKFALFISLHGGKGMDSVNPLNDRATLWTVGVDDERSTSNNSSSSSSNDAASDPSTATTSTFQVRPYYTGLLRDVNIKAKQLEESVIVPYIQKQQKNNDHNSTMIRGIICISCDPNDVNYNTLSTAASHNVPITGSGGTSLSAAVKIHSGLQLVGNAGGSVATTTYTRAVSYVHALASYWDDLEYRPFTTSISETDHNGEHGCDVIKPHLRSVLDACLPSFIAVCLACHLLYLLKYLIDKVQVEEDTNKMNGYIANYSRYLLLPIKKLSSRSNDSTVSWVWIDQLLSLLKYQALPTVCSVVTATSFSPEHGSTAIMASTVASFGCWGSILSGLLAGWLVSQMLGRTLFACIRMNIPATMTNILVAGCIGPVVAIILGASGVTQFLGWVTEMVRSIVRTSSLVDFIASITVFSWNDYNFSGLGFVVGCLFCYGSKVGWYHSIFLPIILIEMEHGEASLWGAMDECTLVIVSAGICCANILTSSSSLESIESKSTSVCKRGLLINLLCGDFIEVAYPFMEESQIVNFAGYFASGVAGEILYCKDPAETLSSAYLPVCVGVVLARDKTRMTVAILSSFFISFSGMMLSNAQRKGANLKKHL